MRKTFANTYKVIHKYFVGFISKFIYTSVLYIALIIDRIKFSFFSIIVLINILKLPKDTECLPLVGGIQDGRQIEKVFVLFVGLLLEVEPSLQKMHTLFFSDMAAHVLKLRPRVICRVTQVIRQSPTVMPV